MTTEFNNLQNGVKSGSSISGVSILSSTVTAVGGTISPQTDDGPNLKLIIGISVPIIILSTLCLILVIIVIIWFLRKNKNQSDKGDMEDSTERSNMYELNEYPK